MHKKDYDYSCHNKSYQCITIDCHSSKVILVTKAADTHTKAKNTPHLSITIDSWLSVF
ncbi:MAG: hypothetical protein ABI288_04480 [Ginsengibacter sp.]